MTKIDDEEINEFVEYVLEFYGRDGIYCLNYTDKMIRDCVLWRIKNQEYLGEFEGDSIDRENIKYWIANKYKIKL